MKIKFEKRQDRASTATEAGMIFRTVLKDGASGET